MSSQLLYIRDNCIHLLFEDQVERSPDSLAVMFEDQKLTYRELNSRANQVAHYLKSLGIEPEMLVGICLERSVEMIVGLMGILKAGGAYVPLDPTYPKDRLAFILSDTQVPLVLTQSGLIKELFEQKLQTICIDTEIDLISKMSQENLINELASDNLAYVIYTSGSTGNPKGVMITHGNLYHYVQAMVMRLGIEPSDRYLHTASFAFSSSVRQLMLPLSQGATVLITNSEQRKNPLVMFEMIKNHKVTVIDIIPSYWRNCVNVLAEMNADKRHDLLNNQLRLIVSASEPLPSVLPRCWLQDFKHGASLINMFGQTETTGIVTTNQISFDHDEGIKTVAIGKPLPNTQAYILDEQLNPLPVGDSGILYVGGATLARGYLNRPDLTAEKFINNPFINQEGSRIYNTGDRARYLPDGNIEFIGRMDDQVKIRGFRVELGEVEAALAQHFAIQDTVVIAREDSSNDKRLIAYVVIVEEEQHRISDLRSFLKEHLPDYMIPSAFVSLLAIPRTPNGKIDRRALPTPERFRTQLGTEYVPPSNHIEKVLATIWEDILGMEQVGVNDNFFDLGGHSILSVRLISEIEKTFKCNISLKSLFQISTIAEIAKLIWAEPSEMADINELRLGLSLEDYGCLLSHTAGKAGLRIGKRGLIVNVPPEAEVVSHPFVWIGEVQTGKRLKLNQPIYVMPGASLSSSMNSHTDYVSAIASLLVDELLSVESSNSYSLGGWCYNGLVAMEMAQQLHKLGKNVELLTLIDVSRRTKLYKMVHKLNLRVGTIRFHSYNISKLSIKEKKKYILDRINQKNIDSIESKEKAIDNDVKPKQIGRLLSKAYTEYTPKIYVSKVLLVTGVKHFVHGLKNLVQFNLSWLFPYNGWGDLLQGKVYVSKIQCDHLELMEDPYCEEIGRMIQLSNRDKS